MRLADWSSCVSVLGPNVLRGHFNLEHTGNQSFARGINIRPLSSNLMCDIACVCNPLWCFAWCIKCLASQNGGGGDEETTFSIIFIFCF